jgi:uncharacterized glyoxalase superfamily protein PhnB
VTQGKIIASAPILLVKDVVKSAEYFRDKVGFTDQRLFGHPTNFAIIRRDGIALMLSQLGEGQTDTPHWQVVEKMWNVYFWVDDAQAIYAEMQNSGAIIDYTLYDTPWGIREFGIQDLDDHDIAFGQVLR